MLRAAWTTSTAACFHITQRDAKRYLLLHLLPHRAACRLHNAALHRGGQKAKHVCVCVCC